MIRGAPVGNIIWKLQADYGGGPTCICGSCMMLTFNLKRMAVGAELRKLCISESSGQARTADSAAPRQAMPAGFDYSKCLAVGSGALPRLALCTRNAQRDFHSCLLFSHC